MPKLSEWYHVFFDDSAIYRQVDPPGQAAWSDEFGWDSIIRVCFQTGSLFESDELYIFTAEREASYLIPTEAAGGVATLDEIIRRKRFPAEYIIEMMSSAGERSCWPAIAA